MSSRIVTRGIASEPLSHSLIGSLPKHLHNVSHAYLAVAQILLFAVSGCSMFLLSGCSASYSGSTSSVPTLTMTTSGTPSSYGSAVTFTATVSNGPTGTVTIEDAGSPIGTGTLSGTTTTFTTSRLANGTHTITASWEGNTRYSAVTSSPITQIVVQAAALTPTITWATPAPIAFGTALSAAQFDASSTVPGTFTYSPAAGTVLSSGSQTLSVTFTPTDTTDYNTTSATVTLIVNQSTPLTPTITWSTPAPITFGTALSATQFDASSTVPGTFTYSPASGTVLNSGSQTLSVTFTPTDTTDYNTATATVTLTVNQGSTNQSGPLTPVITWATPAAITFGTALSTTQLDATTTVPGTFAYSPALGTALNSGSQTLSVTFTPTDIADYNTAAATVTLTVSKASPAITWASSAPITSGTALSTTQLDATTTVPGTFAYSPALGTALNSGSETLSVTFTPTDTADYNTAAATVALTVIGAVVTVTGPTAPILEGTTFTFTATVTGASNQNVIWTVNGVVSGYPLGGSITPSGVYNSRNATSGTNSISAFLQSDPAIQGSAPVTVIAPTSSPETIGFAFSLPNDAATSAGVYDSNGTLLRTLWSNQPYPPGASAANWDGNDDYGSPAAAGTYQIKVLYNNVTYEWGLIGDTSANWVGPNIWDNQAVLPTDMAISGTTAYAANSYAEGRPQVSMFDLSQPQQPASLFMINVCVLVQYVATDGNLLYFVNLTSGWADSNSYVGAYNPASTQFYSFPAGTTSSECGQTQPFGVIDYSLNAAVAPSGIAVQTKGNLLAVSHGTSWWNSSQDMILLFDKTSGTLLGNIAIPNPQRIAFAPDGDLWAISGNSVVLISSVGTKNIVTTTLPGLIAPLALAVDPNTSDILVADGGTAQQVKRFSSGGRLLSTYGDPGGYTDCNPTVTKDRLFLDETAGTGYPGGEKAAMGGIIFTSTFLAVLPDSSFWVSDPGNARVLHISSQGQYIEQIAFLRFFYYVAADHGNPSRVFAHALEYAVDYTKPLVPGDPDPELGGNGSWSLVRNWSACLPSNYFAFFTAVQTFGNGRTYAEVFQPNPTNLPPWGPLEELVELPASGPLRFSGQFLMPSAWVRESFDHTGNLTWWNYDTQNGAPTQSAYVRTLTGYDDNDWPVWDNPQLLAYVPDSCTFSAYGCTSNDPNEWGGWGMTTFPQPSSGGIYATNYPSPATPGLDHHVGGVLAGGKNWLWKASPGAVISSPDGHGTFPDIGGYGGHDGIGALVEGSNIFEGYDGQWGSFSSQWMHWSEDGLLIGQFGHSASGETNGILFPGAAGNIATMATVTVGANIYLYNSDEGNHTGIHQWKISGLDSIHEVSGTAQLGGAVDLQ
jgi:hypothetical protein